MPLEAFDDGPRQLGHGRRMREDNPREHLLREVLHVGNGPDEPADEERTALSLRGAVLGLLAGLAFGLATTLPTTTSPIVDGAPSLHVTARTRPLAEARMGSSATRH
mgnify:CR=1 FL=1